jgi:ABC-type bacteriocin/lantibiotic exporter with double-glycine peptidase domain
LTTIHKIYRALTSKEKHNLLWGAAGELLLQLGDTAFFAALLGLIALYANEGVMETHLPFLGGWLTNYPVLLPAGFLLAYGGKNLLGWWWARRQWEGIYKVATRLSAQKLSRFLESDYDQYVHVDTALQVRRISQQPVEYTLYLLRNGQILLVQGILIVLLAGGLVLYKPQLAGLLALFLLPPACIIIFLFQRKQSDVRTGVKNASARALQYLKEALAGYVESRIFQKKDFFVNRYASEQRVLNGQLASQQSVQSASSRLMEVFAVLAVTVLIMGSKLFEGALSVVTVGAFAAAAYKVLPGLTRIINSLGQIKAYAFVLEDLPAPEPVSEEQRYGQDRTIRSLRFEGVSFSFGEKSILQQLSFLANAGDFIGIRGLSGRGKTTLVNILLGFYAPASGKVYINDQLLNAVTPSPWWQRISYVKQQPFFVHDTMIKNVVLADDGYDEAWYRRVAELAGCTRFTIEQSGQDGLIRENGKNISGGQRQRLALARALYKDFDLLILDEPFSEMDEESEAELLQHLEWLAGQGKIILLITHNSKSFRYCHKLISLDA